MLCERHGYCANVRADIGDSTAWRNQLTQKLNFTLTILAVQFERSSDDLVVAVIDETSVPRLRKLVERRGSLLAGSPRFRGNVTHCAFDFGDRMQRWLNEHDILNVRAAHRFRSGLGVSRYSERSARDNRSRQSKLHAHRPLLPQNAVACYAYALRSKRDCHHVKRPHVVRADRNGELGIDWSAYAAISAGALLFRGRMAVLRDVHLDVVA